MRVLKVVAQGPTTSFRYPHFAQTIHPTYEMPPPATIYGHICSALGEWVNPSGLLFSYHFSYQAEAVDKEHVIVLSRSRGKLKGTEHPKNLEGRVNPFDRHILFQPRLVLYINRPEWAAAFRSPRYTVVLGRSQDLMTYTSVSSINLERSDSAYLEHGLLPFELAARVRQGYTVLMPRYIDYADHRHPYFARYLVLHSRLYVPRDISSFADNDCVFWTDPQSPEDHGTRLGLCFHSFVGPSYEAYSLAN